MCKMVKCWTPTRPDALSLLLFFIFGHVRTLIGQALEDIVAMNMCSGMEALTFTQEEEKFEEEELKKTKNKEVGEEKVGEALPSKARNKDEA